MEGPSKSLLKVPLEVHEKDLKKVLEKDLERSLKGPSGGP